MKSIRFVLFLFALIASTANAQQASQEQVYQCLMNVTAQSMLSPQQEAHRKVVCYEGTRGLADDCERSVAATMRLPSASEQHYKAQCRRVTPS